MSAALRIGQGFDVHALVPGRRLVLGGIEIPGRRGLLGHSDADVLAHAVTDALLGAAGLGDIGQRFPDTDPRWAGADSMQLLAAVVADVRAAGWVLVNLDCTVVAREPRIAPHAAAIRASLARVLGAVPERIGVKGKTTEGLGFTGRGEGVAVFAVALLERGA